MLSALGVVLVRKEHHHVLSMALCGVDSTCKPHQGEFTVLWLLLRTHLFGPTQRRTHSFRENSVRTPIVYLNKAKPCWHLRYPGRGTIKSFWICICWQLLWFPFIAARLPLHQPDWMPGDSHAACLNNQQSMLINSILINSSQMTECGGRVKLHAAQQQHFHTFLKWIVIQ